MPAQPAKCETDLRFILVLSYKFVWRQYFPSSRQNLIEQPSRSLPVFDRKVSYINSFGDGYNFDGEFRKIIRKSHIRRLSKIR